MSLIRCHECDSEISELAVSCPNCGAPSKSQLKLGKHHAKMFELQNELDEITTKNLRLKALLLCVAFVLGFLLAFETIKSNSSIEGLCAGPLIFMIILISNPYHSSLKRLRNKIKIQSRIFESMK